jgi:16S rRNA (guanine966-N2)-methyltransferase
VRPTGDRVREAVFNILAHGDFGAADPVADQVVLDAFCGTGAIGLEALSRGARLALFLDSAPASLAVARRNAERLGEAGRCRFLRGDATRPPAAPEAAGLVFLDPPYGQGLLAPALQGLRAAGWLAPGAVCVAEAAAGEAWPVPDGFTLVQSRRYGAAEVSFLVGPAAVLP